MKRRFALLLLAFVLFLAVTPPALALAAEDKEPWAAEDKGTTIEKLLAWPLSFPLRVVEKIGEAGGFQALNKLVFMSGMTDEERKNLPWSGNEKQQVYTWYWILAIVTAPFYALAAVAAGVKMLAAGAAGKPSEREEALDALQRWLLAIVLVGVMPTLVTGLMWLTSILVYAIAHGFDAVAIGRGIADWGQVSLTQMDFATGSVLGTVLLKVFFAIMYIYMNFLYIVRKVCMTAMFCFTPLAALIWAINRKTTAIPIWLGELASNAFMPVAHGLVLCTILAICDVKDTQNTWLTLLISLYALIPTAEAIRNSMMSLIARLGGVSEERTALAALGAVAGLGSLVGLGRAAGATLGSGKTPLPPAPPPNVPPVLSERGFGSGSAGSAAGGMALAGMETGAAAPAAGAGTGAAAGAAAMSAAGKTPVLSSVKSAAAGTAVTMGKTATVIGSAVGGAVPGGAVVAEAMGAAAGKAAGAAHAGAKLAWEAAKDPQAVKGEVKEAVSQKAEAVKEKWGEVQQVGRNIAQGAQWVGAQTVGRLAPRYAAFTARSKIR